MASDQVITDVKIFTGHHFIEKGYVRFNDGVITSIGEGDFVNPTADTIILSRPGHTLTPGLIDSHIHALGGNVQSIEQSLRFGVTTVCDMFNDHKHIAQLQELARNPSNISKYADFKCAGLGAVVEEGWPAPVVRKEFEHVPNGSCVADKLISSWPKITAPADAKPFVKRQVQESKASYLKMFQEPGDSLGLDLPQPTLEIQEALVTAAHRYGIKAVGHAFSYAGAMGLLRAGVDGLTHIFFDEPPRDDFVRIMKDQGAHCNPTLGLCASQTGEGQEILQRFMEDSYAQRMLLNRNLAKPVGFASEQKPKSSIQHAYNNTKALYKAGVPIILGTDAAGKDIGIPYGLGVHLEVYLLGHEIGMTPVDVLTSSTSSPADRFGFNDRGKIEKGRLADFVLFEGDIETALADPECLCLPIKSVWRLGITAECFN